MIIINSSRATIAIAVGDDEWKGSFFGVCTMISGLGRVSGGLLAGLMLTGGREKYFWLPMLSIWILLAGILMFYYPVMPVEQPTEKSSVKQISMMEKSPDPQDDRKTRSESQV